MVLINSFSVGVKLAAKFESDRYEWNLPSSMYTFTSRETDVEEVVCCLKGLSVYSNLDLLNMESKF